MANPLDRDRIDASRNGQRGHPPSDIPDRRDDDVGSSIARLVSARARTVAPSGSLASFLGRHRQPVAAPFQGGERPIAAPRARIRPSAVPERLVIDASDAIEHDRGEHRLGDDRLLGLAHGPEAGLPAPQPPRELRPLRPIQHDPFGVQPVPRRIPPRSGLAPHRVRPGALAHIVPIRPAPRRSSPAPHWPADPLMSQDQYRGGGRRDSRKACGVTPDQRRLGRDAWDHRPNRVAWRCP